MQVGPADAARTDLDAHFAGSGFRIRPLRPGQQCPSRVENHSVHEQTPDVGVSWEANSKAQARLDVHQIWLVEVTTSQAANCCASSRMLRMIRMSQGSPSSGRYPVGVAEVAREMRLVRKAAINRSFRERQAGFEVLARPLEAAHELETVWADAERSTKLPGKFPPAQLRNCLEPHRRHPFAFGGRKASRAAY